MMVPWQKEFEIGQAEIDSEHRDIVDLLNELDVCVATAAAPEVVDRVLDTLEHALTTHLRRDCRRHHHGHDLRMLDLTRHLNQSRRGSKGPTDRKTVKILARHWLDHLCRTEADTAP